MSEKPGLVSRVFARVRALLPEQWREAAGKRFRDTVGGISEYSTKSLRIRERLDEVPDIGWNSLKVKSSEALLKAAEEENKRIATELARQTLTDKARQEKATADRMETEARISKIKEIEERVTLVEKLRESNCVPVWDSKGNMRVLKAPPDYNWDELTSAIVHTADLSLPAESDSELTGADRDKSQSSTASGTASQQDRE
jgi:hypothetical protein